MTSRETFSDLGCSSSEEDGNRPDVDGRTAEHKAPPAEVRRRHPFSVEALMAGRKTDGRGSDPPHCKAEGGSLAVSPLGVNYLCRERCTLPGGSTKNLPAASPVKSEVSEPEDCAPAWVSKSTFSSQPRKFLQHLELL